MPTTKGLPNIKQLNASLAQDNARVDKFIDGLLGQVDALLGAASTKNWKELGRMSDYLALGGKAYGFPAIAENAQRVASAVRHPENELEIKRGLIKLIGACGRSKKKPEQGTSLN